jgi:uncharacterized protein (TIGR03790 family)
MRRRVRARAQRRLLALSSLPLALCAALLVWLPCAARKPLRVLVLVNGESPVSVAIGEYYRRARGVPESHLLRLEIPLEDPSLSSTEHESVTREVFEERIRKPVERFLRERDWVDAIDVLVTTKGVPLRIADRGVPMDHWLRDVTRASVDAELSLLFTDLVGSAGIRTSVNPYYDSELSFRAFRKRHPRSPPRYLVARLTGYQTPLDEETGVPADVKALVDAAVAPARPGRWLIDEDPNVGPRRDAANLLYLAPAAALLRGLGQTVVHDTLPAFAADASDLLGYASWGSNASRDPRAPFYGEIAGHRYPGTFAPRAISVDLVSTNARSFTHPPEYGQSLVADLIRGGVAGAAGHIDEPTLSALPRPHILLGRYAEGVPAIEAYYRSLPYLGWMNVYVGDPLMTVGDAAEPSHDRDADGIPDPQDDCRDHPNPEQRDTDGDGIGNLCDPDVDGDGTVTTSWGVTFPLEMRGDVEWIALSAKNGSHEPSHDLDGDGEVTDRDISMAQLFLFLPPGPSARTR